MRWITIILLLCSISAKSQLAVSVSIWADQYHVMYGTVATFTATPVNGGTVPAYQWYKNNTIISGATNVSYSYIPSNNDVVKCVMTSSLTGPLANNPASSNGITMVVYTTGSACTGVPTVVHGGKTYNTVQIGTQCWLRENIDYGTRINAITTQTNNAVVEKWCYNNDTMYCNVYGGLYQWAEMVQYLNNATNTTNWSPVPTGNVQGICPTGWHIPKQAEWNTLITYLGGVSLALGTMKQTGSVERTTCDISPLGWVSPNQGATNSSGFTLLPSGWISTTDRSSVFAGFSGNIWMASQPTGSNLTKALWNGGMYAATNMTGGQGYKTTGYSVRCLKD